MSGALITSFCRTATRCWRCRWRSGEPSFRSEMFRAVNPLDFTEEQWTRADGILEKLREQKWTAARVLFGLRGEVRSLFFFRR